MLRQAIGPCKAWCSDANLTQTLPNHASHTKPATSPARLRHYRPAPIEKIQQRRLTLIFRYAKPTPTRNKCMAHREQQEPSCTQTEHRHASREHRAIRSRAGALSYKSSATATHLPEVQRIHARAIFHRMRPDDLRGELERNHADAFGWALACCRWDRSQAEDTLQASYLKILDGRARWDGRSTFRTWLFGVVRRTGAEHRRSVSRYRRRLERWIARGTTAAASTNSNPAEQMVSTEMSRALIQALNQLPQRQRDVLHLVFYQDLTIAEASDVLGVSLGTARTHYERGKTTLRRLLDGRID